MHQLNSTIQSKVYAKQTKYFKTRYSTYQTITIKSQYWFFVYLRQKACDLIFVLEFFVLSYNSCFLLFALIQRHFKINENNDSFLPLPIYCTLQETIVSIYMKKNYNHIQVGIFIFLFLNEIITCTGIGIILKYVFSPII